ncbi:MAG: glycosyltransferase [Marivibrio sp.]|uniref:glycosyltransferase n=1 Tax=Marivibrio sp. TaxID=2039719 RepID=UPI0032EB684A
MAAVAFVLKGYPRLSETFIAQEILGLERRGLDVRLVSLRHPTDDARHPVHDEIRAPILYLPEYLRDEPARVLAGWRRARRLPGYKAARAQWLKDLRRDPSASRARRFGQACVLAAEAPAEVARLHFHFLHTPASVARYAARMRSLPLSGSAHAKDIWTTPEWDLSEKLAEAEWVATCTASGAERLRALAPRADAVPLIYHGVDLSRFPPPPSSAPDGPRTRDGEGPVVILSVGRLVEKKGYDDLIDALARLPQDLAWRFVHIGGGALRETLAARAADAGVAERIEWRGAEPQEAVLEALRAADLFVLASRIAADGDRDGLPNVLMEAQSQALPVLATSVSAIPELILDRETGRLVPPQDPPALAAALEELLRDAAQRRRLGAAGAARVAARFEAGVCLDALAQRFGLAAGGDPVAPTASGARRAP